MRKIESKEIDGYTFTVQQLPMMRAHKVFNRLLKAISSGLVALATSNANLKDMMEQDVGALSGALGALLDRMPETEQEQLFKDLLETATFEKDGQKFKFYPHADEELAGKLLTVYKFVGFALQVNFRDFTDAVATKLKPAGSATANTSQSKA